MTRISVLLFSFGAVFSFPALAQVPMLSAPYTAFEWLARGPTGPSGTTQVGMGLSGSSMPTSPTNLSGWQRAGNFGVNNQATYGQTVGGKADFPLGGGAKAPINVSTPISKASLAASAGMVLKNAARIGIPAVGAVMTASAIKDLFDLGKVYFSDATATPEKPFYQVREKFEEGREWYFGDVTGMHSSRVGACNALIAYFITAINDPRNTITGAVSGDVCLRTVTSSTGGGVTPYLLASNIVNNNEAKPYSLTVDEATAIISAHQARADALQQLINADKEHKQKNGVNPFGYVAPTIGLGTPTITGPATVPGPKSSETSTVRLQPGSNIEAAPGTSSPTDSGTKVTTKEQTHKLAYEGDKITQTTVTNTVTNITNNVTNITTIESEKVEVKDPEVKDPEVKDPEDPPVDTPLGKVPKLYERKYPDGLVGIWGQKSASLRETSVAQLVTQLMPVGLTGGACPVWSIPLDVGIANFGVFDASVPCQYWGYIRVIMIIGSLFMARALIFGG